MFREPGPIGHNWKWPWLLTFAVIVGIWLTITRMWLNPLPVSDLSLFGTLALIISAAGISLTVNFLADDQ